MQTHRMIGRAPIVAMIGFGLFAGAAPVMAANVVRIGHRVLTERILGDAHDRYNVRFRTTHVEKVSSYRRLVEGQGSFSRRGKSTQWFRYHATVNPHDGSIVNVGYNIR